MSHLPEDVLRLGVPDTFSAFPFENHLEYIKSLVKSSTRPLQQICHRIWELESSCINNEFIMKSDLENTSSAYVINSFERCFKNIHWNNCALSINSYSKADSYCFTSKYIIQIERITQN